MSDKMKKNLYALKNKSFVPLTLAPALLIIVGFTYIPALYSFVLSLFKTKLFTAERFIGLEHYISVFKDESFWNSFGINHKVIFDYLFKSSYMPV